MRGLVVVAALCACGSDDPPMMVGCTPVPLYLDRMGGTFVNGTHDDAILNASVLVDVERVLPPWPHDDVDWQSVVDCVRTALLLVPRVEVTEQDPGNTPHLEIVFTTSYWAGAGTTHLVPGSCRVGHQIELVFGDALPTASRACHVAMQGFAQMTGQLSLGDDCHDFVNNAQDCSETRSFLDQTVNCVDASNQPATCRCGGATTQNTLTALAAVFPTCP